MKQIEKDFIKQFGQDIYMEVLERAGCHSNERVPVEKDERLIFSLLEIIDYECYYYEDLNKKVTESALKRFLLEHCDELKNYKGSIPSYIGLFAGAFDFLKGMLKDK